MKKSEMFCLLIMFLMLSLSQTAEARIPQDNDECNDDIEKLTKDTFDQCMADGMRTSPENEEWLKERCENEARKRRVICEEKKKFDKLPENFKYPPPPPLDASISEWNKWEKKIDRLIEEYPFGDKGQYPEKVAEYRIRNRRERTKHDRKKLDKTIKDGMAPNAPDWNSSDDEWKAWQKNVNDFISAQPEQNSAYVRKLKSWRDGILREKENQSRFKELSPEDIRKKGDSPSSVQKKIHNSASYGDEHGENKTIGDKQGVAGEWWPARPALPESPENEIQCRNFEQQWQRYIKLYFEKEYKDAEAYGGDAQKIRQLDESKKDFEAEKTGEVKKCYRRIANGNKNLSQIDASVDQDLKQITSEVEANVESARNQNNQYDNVTSELDDAQKSYETAITDIEIKNGKTRDEILLTANYNNMNSQNAAKGNMGSGIALKRISIQQDTCQADDGNGEVAAAIKNGRDQGYSIDEMMSLVRRQIEAYRQNLKTLDLRFEEHRKAKAVYEESIVVNQAVLDALECMKRKGNSSTINSNASANRPGGERPYNGSGQYYPAFELEMPPIEQDYEDYCGIEEACSDRKLKQLPQRQRPKGAAPASGRTHKGIR